MNRTEKTGDVVGLMEVLPEDEIMIITRGVRLVNLDGGDLVTAVARVIPDDTDVEGGNGTERGPMRRSLLSKSSNSKDF